MDDCVKKAEKLHRNGKLLESVQYYLLSTQPDVGLQIGVEHVKGDYKKEKFLACKMITLP